jgi:hypothetical protein
LISLAKKDCLHIYVSEIVCFELAKNTKFNLEKYIKDIDKSIRDYNKYTPTKINKFELKQPNDLLEKIRSNLIKNSINIIKCDYNTIINETMKKYLDNKKPFDHNKDSFKDSLIWLTYVAYIKDKKLLDNFFISNNTTDFEDKKTKKLHDDLIIDISEITYYRNINELFDDTIVKKVLNDYSLRKTANALKYWYNKNITEYKIKNLFYTKYFSDVEYKIFIYCSKLDASSYGNYTFSGFIDNETGFEIDNFKLINIDFLSEIYIQGECDLLFNANLLGRTPDPELDEDEFFTIKSIEFNEKVHFTLVINSDLEYDYFEINIEGDIDEGY